MLCSEGKWSVLSQSLPDLDSYEIANESSNFRHFYLKIIALIYIRQFPSSLFLYLFLVAFCSSFCKFVGVYLIRFKYYMLYIFTSKNSTHYFLFKDIELTYQRCSIQNFSIAGIDFLIIGLLFLYQTKLNNFDESDILIIHLVTEYRDNQQSVIWNYHLNINIKLICINLENGCVQRVMCRCMLEYPE